MKHMLWNICSLYHVRIRYEAPHMLYDLTGERNTCAHSRHAYMQKNRGSSSDLTQSCHGKLEMGTLLFMSQGKGPNMEIDNEHHSEFQSFFMLGSPILKKYSQTFGMLGCILHSACQKLDPIMQKIILEKIEIYYCCLKQLATLHDSQISSTHGIFGDRVWPFSFNKIC